MMKFWRGVALGAAVLFIASASVQAAELSLYKRLGEQPGISYIVDTFVAKVGGDARINKYFAHTNMPHLKYEVVQQLGQATGGPQKYSGKDMKSAHEGLHITKGAFNAFVEDLVWSLNKTGVGKQEQKELLARLAPMEPDIVEEAPPAAPAKKAPAKAKAKANANQ
jgi:hemoglobin